MLCEAERSVLTTLGWDINLVTGIDTLHKLLSFADPQPQVEPPSLRGIADCRGIVQYPDVKINGALGYGRWSPVERLQSSG